MAAQEQNNEWFSLSQQALLLQQPYIRLNLVASTLGLKLVTRTPSWLLDFAS